jgi:hypothetical protein
MDGAGQQPETAHRLGKPAFGVRPNVISQAIRPY